MTKSDILDLCQRVQRLYPGRVSAFPVGMAQLWYDALQPYDAALVTRVVHRWAQRYTFKVPALDDLLDGLRILQDGAAQTPPAVQAPSARAAYQKKLLDPRWQRKRLAVFARDAWICRSCADGASTLQVHHLYYLPNAEPWEYPMEALLTLCAPCHKRETTERPRAEATVLAILKARGLLTNEVYALAALLEFPEGGTLSTETLKILGWSLRMTKGDQISVEAAARLGFFAEPVATGDRLPD